MEYPLLVAPRPVRLASAYHAIINKAHSAHDRVRIADTNSLDDFKLALFADSSADKDSLSPRSSPRSGLPSEALEEFLSILRPSFFPPASPVLRTRRQAAASLPAYTQDRTYSLQGRTRLELLPQHADDDMDISRSQQPSRNAICHTPESMTDESPPDFDIDGLPFRWYKNNALSSPISRTHTRNPFLRYASDQSPALISPLSPASIPLPQPTPDEMVDF
ncbi:hypothetical protein H0H92_012258 [Tricholoma furcatifolium]|nr:hypothetical protein H0H92_012258 [Tricholoma furcatifolium]